MRTKDQTRRLVTVYMDYDTFSMLEEAVLREWKKAADGLCTGSARSRSRIAEMCMRRGLEVELGRAVLMQSGDAETLSPIVSRDPEATAELRQGRRSRPDVARDQWEKQKREVRRITGQLERFLAVTPDDGTRTMIADIKIKGMRARIEDAQARAETARARLESYIGPIVEEDEAMPAPRTAEEFVAQNPGFKVVTVEVMDTGVEPAPAPLPLPWEVKP